VPSRLGRRGMVAGEAGPDNVTLAPGPGSRGSSDPVPQPACSFTIPAELRRTLTWDQGKEMAEHAKFSVDHRHQGLLLRPA